MSLFLEIAACLWPNNTTSCASLALGVSDRTVRRWISGEAVVPVGAWNDLLAIVDAVQEGLQGMRPDLLRECGR